MRAVRTTFYALLSLAAGGNLIAQVPTMEPVVIRSDVRLVVLPVTVEDRSGRPTQADLPANSFRVFENGVAQSISTFKHEDLPISLGLVLDHSGSMSYKNGSVAAAALDLVRDSNRNDEVFVANFGGRTYLDAAFTNDERVLRKALSRDTVHGNTAMWDAVSQAINYMTSSSKRDKKVLLVVTDGEDISSSTSLERVIGEAQSKGILVYSIGLLGSGGEARRAKHGLKALSAGSGGQAFFPKNLAGVDEIAHKVAHEIRSQYTIAYTPVNPGFDGRFRSIRVTVGKRGLVARTRGGYYATP